ncbi:hypothetical protein DW669_16175, partial [Lachnospiraceae bacterium AM25-17]
ERRYLQEQMSFFVFKNRKGYLGEKKSKKTGIDRNISEQSRLRYIIFLRGHTSGSENPEKIP